MTTTALPTTLLLATLALSGCVIAVDGDGHGFGHDEDWRAEQVRNREYINRLTLGTRQASVEGALGDPAFRESFQRHGEVFDVLFYRTRHTDSDGHTGRDETTPLVFVDGSLVGWGESAISEATGGKPVRHVM